MGGSVQETPLEKVFLEIDEIISLDYDCLWIADDCFTLDSEYLAEFCYEMCRRKVPIPWICLSRVDKLTPELATLTKEAGCRRVYLGLEFGSNETLRLVNKRVTVKVGVRAVRLFSQAGIGTAGFSMVGYPN